MSGTLMLVNPRKRRARKGRTAAQKAATKRMIAANRAKRRSNPAPRRAVKRRRTASAPAVAYRRARRRNPVHHVRHTRRRRRHNPIGLGHMHIGALLKSGAIGATGALAVEALFGFLPLPASVSAKTNADGSTNYLNVGSKLALAVVLGTLGRKIFKRAAPGMALGAVTVEMFSLIKPMVAGAFPSLGLGYYSPAFMASGQVIPGGSTLGQYVSAGFPPPVQAARLGAYTGAYVGAPGQTVGASATAMNKERASYVR